MLESAEYHQDTLTVWIRESESGNSDCHDQHQTPKTALNEALRGYLVYQARYIDS